MHKHLPYSSLKVKGMTVFKHSTVMMKAAREGFISGMYELFTQENNLKVLKISLYSGTLQSSGVWCAWGLGITCCFLLSCLQMLWQAERGQRALFHTSARNVINISKGNICHPPTPVLSHTCIAWTNRHLSLILLGIHLQRGMKWCLCGIMNVFTPCSTQRFPIWAGLQCFDPWKDSYQAIWRRRKVTQ